MSRCQRALTVIAPRYDVPVNVNEPLPSCQCAASAECARCAAVVRRERAGAERDRSGSEWTDRLRSRRVERRAGRHPVGPLLKAFAIPARRTPAPTTVPPVAMFVPKRASTPAPDFVSAPALDMPPLTVSVDAPCTSIVFPLAPSVNARADVKLLATDSVCARGSPRRQRHAGCRCFPSAPLLATSDRAAAMTMVPPGMMLVASVSRTPPPVISRLRGPAPSLMQPLKQHGRAGRGKTAVCRRGTSAVRPPPC